MTLSVAQVKSEIEQLFDKLQAQVLDQIGQSLPLVGPLALPVGTALFATLETAIKDALDAIPDDPGAELIDQIAEALDGLDYVQAARVGDDLTITLTYDEPALELDPQPFALDVGLPTLGLDVSGAFAASLTPKLDIDLKLDGEGADAGDLTIVDGADALSVDLEVDIDVDAEAELGFLKLELADNDAAAPEIDINFTVDLPAGDPGDVPSGIEADLTGAIAIDWSMIAAGVSFLPDIYADLKISYPLNGPIAAAVPTIAFEGVEVDFGSYVRVISETLGELAGIFNAAPFGQLFDALTAPIPGIQDVLEEIGWVDEFDVVGDDGVVSVVDLACLMTPSLIPQVEPFYKALLFINTVRKLNDGDGGGSVLKLGDITLLGAASSSAVGASSAGALLPYAAGQVLGPLGALFTPTPGKTPIEQADDLISAGGSQIANVLKSLNSSLYANTGLSLPLLDDPSKIMDLLFNKAGAPVDLVTYDVPKIEVKAQYEQYIPLLGPIGLVFGGGIFGSIDIDVGFDTRGFQSGNLAEGLFFNTPALPTSPTGFAPAGTLGTFIFAGGGINAVLVSAYGKAELGFVLNAYLDANFDGKLYLTELGDSCIFDPITGKAYVDIYVELSAGIGPFSISTKIPIADITLAEFDIFECPPETPEFSPLYGLAEQITNSMVLNVGARADLRRLYRDDGTYVQGDDATQPESYRVTLARNPGDDDVLPGEPTPGALVPGSLDVYAFGRVQRYGTLDAPLNLITGSFGALSDTLVIEADVAIDASVSGGAGGDLLYGGGGDDRFHGDGDNDVLSGAVGNDTLVGGSGDDDLIGGTGADSMDGGSGRDKVSYEKANIALGVGVVMAVVDGKMRGFNGDAQGDSIEDVEYVVGTRFGDILLADPTNILFGDEYNTLEGRDGNDVLVGVELKDDFLLGGRGADNMNGKSGFDGTSYATSFGGVFVNLGADIYFGGDATGDWLNSIEAVGGSNFNDVLIGDSSDNLLDGANGDDFLGDGGGAGEDTINGGGGDDTVLGGVNDDTLSGDGGRDLLSYSAQLAAVHVDLEQGFAEQRFNPFSLDDDIALEIEGYSTFENLEGGGQSDSLVGDRAYNTIWGLQGADTIRGGSGGDTLIGGAGADSLDGQDGLDWADYSTSPGAVQITLSGGAGTGADAAGDRTVAVENLIGSVFSDSLAGDAGGNIIDPYLSGILFGDTVFGDGGTDTLRLDYSIEDLGRGLVGGFNLGSTSAGAFSRLLSSGLFTLDSVGFTSIEKLDVVGTFRNDTVYGGGLDDRIVVGSGDDLVISGAGADVVLAQGGADFVTYGTDANRNLTPFIPAGPFYLNGGSDIDVLSISLGGDEDDVVISGAAPGVVFNGVNYANAQGAAVLNFEILRDVITGGGNDRITQLGRYDNVFQSGDRSDDLRPGWGFDTVHGGDDRDGLSFEDDETYLEILSPEIFFGGGDILRLDYREIEEGRWVQGFTRTRESDQSFALGGRYVGMWSTSGDYAVYAGVRQITDEVDFTGIEQLDVYGSRGDDRLWGTYLSIPANFVPEGVESARGDDVLRGEGGNDEIVGWTGDDLILGGDGDDTLSGDGDPSGYSDSQTGGAPFDANELDTLTGGDGADAFVLGTVYDVFHDDGTSFVSSSNRAIITDFNPAEGDTIVLRAPGRLNPNYRVEEVDGNTLIYVRDGRGPNQLPDPSRDELIAEILDFTGFDLGAGYVTYVGASPNFDAASPIGSLGAQEGDIGLEPVERVVSTSAETGGTPDDPDTQPANGGAFTVTQNNVASQLRTAFGDLALDADNDGLADATNVSFSISGSGEAFGTFQDDPFGLGAGIVLSTGRVVELPGPNLVDGGLSGPSLSVPLTFVKIGRLGNTDIFRAEITGLNLDIKSLTLTDADIRSGGGGGVASGFDIDFVAFSSTKLNAFDGTDPAQAAANDVNSAAVLPRLDVLDYTNANIFFTAGTQRPPANGFNPGPNLIGTVNGIVQSPGSLAARDGDGSFLGAVSLGDGGSLAFDLKGQLDTSSPVYLYVGEAGASGEQLEGSISVANTNVVPLGDLSTDLGAIGLGGDTTKLTYKFTPAVGKNSLVFDFVLFTEALKEMAGKFPQDAFKIVLNGVDLATLSDGSAATLSNLMIAPNAPAHPDLIHNTPGVGPAADVTRADAFTKPLTFTGPVVAGVENTLVIEVKDLGDAWLDSGILLQSIRLSDDYFGGFGGFGVNPPPGGGGVPGVAKILVDGSDDPLTESGQSGTVTVKVPNEVPIDQPVTVTLTPTDGLDIGGGAGQSVDVVLTPGQREITLAVQAVDVAGPPLPGKIDFEVNSVDPLFDGLPLAPVAYEVVGNPPPVFSGGADLDVFILENTTAAATVTATDPDGGSVAFSLAGGADQALFTIDPTTGQLSFVDAPDFEAPADAGADNVYDVVVRATDQEGEFAEQTVSVTVQDVAARTMKVSFVSESTPLRSTMGWYDAATGRGGILFSSIEGAGSSRTVKPGDFKTFSSEADPGSIHYFLVPNGGALAQNSAQELAKPIQLVQVGGVWAVATVGPDGEVEMVGGQPNLLFGQGASAYFTEAAKNPGGLDYASSRSGPTQTPATLAGDTADGPTGLLAWEDLAPNLGKAGDADYNDGVFLASWLASSAQPASGLVPVAASLPDQVPLSIRGFSLGLIGIALPEQHTLLAY